METQSAIYFNSIDIGEVDIHMKLNTYSSTVCLALDCRSVKVLVNGAIRVYIGDISRGGIDCVD